MSRRKTLAVLIDHLDPMVGGYAGQLQAAFDAECRKLDQDLLMVVGRSLGGPGPHELAQNTAYDLIRPGSVDGVVLVAGGLASFSGVERLAEYCDKLRPLPLCSVGLQIPGVPSIVIDPRPGLWDLIEHLVRKHACSRIAFIGGPPQNPEAEQRLETYRECLTRHGLNIDPDLIENGPFTLIGGSEATARVLERTRLPQAFVAANDSLALGVIKTLQSKGLKVPGDVIVTGFDDLAFARFSSPPLTTIRQPLRRMASLAVRSVQAQLEGLASSRTTELPVELTVRSSCGCGELEAEAPPTSNRVVMHPADYLEAQSSRIQSELTNNVELRAGLGLGWSESLLQALKLELAGDRGAFASCLDELLAPVDASLQLYDELQKVVTRLRDGLSAVGSPALEEVWHTARRSIARANSQGHARLRQELDMVYQHLLHTGERFASAVDRARLKAVMADALPRANIREALVLLYPDAGRDKLVPFFCMHNGAPVELDPTPYPAELLLPPSVPAREERSTAYLLPLTFGAEVLGVAIFGARSGIHEMLRVQIGVALQTVTMQQKINAQSAGFGDERTRVRLKQLSGMLSAVAKDLERAASELSPEASEPET